MESVLAPLNNNKNIALVAHDNMKPLLNEWVRKNADILANHTLYATGTTGYKLEAVLEGKSNITKFISGPLGGDQQIGSKISEGIIDMLVFFWDPFEPMPHDPDVKALLRIAAVWNIPVACNSASADFLISSPLMQASYERAVPDYEAYLSKRV